MLPVWAILFKEFGKGSKIECAQSQSSFLIDVIFHTRKGNFAHRMILLTFEKLSNEILSRKNSKTGANRGETAKKEHPVRDGAACQCHW